ncbi:MAG: class I SAM-dependent methyltransferase [Deltaproteobacteria bacterium]|nr:class I SAM-dependent methyltransferase [Deltaproteobacteria bacterium]
MIRWFFFPGLDLHTRNRTSLCYFWSKGERNVLDAGSGNGYFSWLAYKSGATVVAMNCEEKQIEKANSFFIDYLGENSEKLIFEQKNLYQLNDENRVFDEIICYEVLEHIKNDSFVCEQFYRILRPGGTLHLCCPNSSHPRHKSETLDLEEMGGHYRPGYSEEDYHKLLLPIGFHIEVIVGLGPSALYYADAILRKIRSHTGDAFALPLFSLFYPFIKFARFNPNLPFSIYVKATKPVHQ